MIRRMCLFGVVNAALDGETSQAVLVNWAKLALGEKKMRIMVRFGYL